MSMISIDQQLEAFLPLYDTVPETWDEGRQFLIEQLKKISTAVNAREIGAYLDTETLSGGQFIPSVPESVQEGVNPNTNFRDMYRKVIDMGAIVIGANAVPHGLTFDANFTLMSLYVSGTNSVGFTAATYMAPEVNMDVLDVTFTSPVAYDRAFAFIEYIYEI